MTFVLSPKGPNDSVQNDEQRGCDAAQSSEREGVNYRSQAPTKLTITSQSSTAKRDVPHTRTVLLGGGAGMPLQYVLSPSCPLSTWYIYN